MPDGINGADPARIPELEQQIAALQQQLHRSERRERIMRQILDNIPATIYATGNDGIIMLANTSFAAQWGRRPADFEGHSLTELFPPETAAAWQQHVDAALSDARVTTNHETYGEGEAARHYNNLRFPLYDEGDTVVALGGFSVDITDRVRAETRYAEMQQILEGIVNNSPAVIYVKNIENRLLLVNQAYAVVVGRPVEELVGHTENEIFPAHVVAAWREADRQMYSSGEPLRYTNTFMVEGEPREFVSLQFPIYDRQQQPYAICGISTDMTELRRAERDREQLQREIIEAQQAALLELSTPLIPIAENVVVMPLIGSIDSARASRVMETLMEGVTTHGSQFAILDITGLPVVDSQVANALLHAAQAVKLLGAEVVLTGIGPDVAQTLIGIGADLSSLKTPGTLQAGIDYALRSRR